MEASKPNGQHLRAFLALAPNTATPCIASWLTPYVVEEEEEEALSAACGRLTAQLNE